ncbi:Nsdhl [Scenedesmus sp. PABB004]|nr:Nsdhl [Scenedesmus sp. PABB004]
MSPLDLQNLLSRRTLERVKWAIFITVPVWFGYGFARNPDNLEWVKRVFPTAASDPQPHGARELQTLHDALAQHELEQRIEHALEELRKKKERAGNARRPARAAGRPGMAPKKRTALVVGGAGFLGQHVVRQLSESGRYDVRVFDIRPAGLPGVESVVGDIRRPADVAAAVEGVDVVIHVATATPTSENALNKTLMDEVNVAGTANVIAACRAAGVRALVYTSSASVVFDGRDLMGVDETTPYTTRPMDYYTQTKVAGEKLALAANGPDLAVVALRPSGIFGEGDTVMVPTFVRQARAGKMKYIIGPGTNVWDFTYVGNVAQAHVLAADKLCPGGPLAGQALFVTNQEPVPFWAFTGDVLSGLGYPRPSVRLPLALILAVAMIFEYIIRPLLRPIKELSTDFTVFRVRIVTRQRAFSCARARDLLGYVPAVSIAEGVSRTCAHFAHLRNPDAPPPAEGAGAGGAGGARRRKAA